MEFGSGPFRGVCAVSAARIAAGLLLAACLSGIVAVAAVRGAGRLREPAATAAMCALGTLAGLSASILARTQ